MFIAHLPAGFLASHCIVHTQRLTGPAANRVFALGMLGSVLPDFDMFYFYTLGGQEHSHHSYWTHIPSFWLACGVLALMVVTLRGQHEARLGISAFLAGIATHLLLDTPWGGIRWFYPFDAQYVRFITVPARYEWWIANFIGHWTFLVELAIVAAAALAHRSRRRRPVAI